MIQYFVLPRYDWKVVVYYLDGESGGMCGAIRRSLKDCGCDDERIEQAISLFRNGTYNTGLTYSNTDERRSVIVIGRTTSIKECANTIIHERKHLESHICQKFNIDPYSEESAYLAGDIGAKMYKYAGRLLCKGCRARFLSNT